MFSIHRTTKLCGIFAVVAVAALLLSAGAQASAAHAAAANANPATYADPGGDSGSAPDITSVVVSNDTNNRISLRVNVTKLDVPSDNSLLLAVDNNRNGATG